MSKQSRFLTFMFCDIVGSTQLTQKHEPEEMFEIVEDFQALCSKQIKSHQGFVARYMGDGVLAYFGYPVAVENSAEVAVHCAFSILQQLSSSGSELKIRVGIANGRGIFGKLDLSGGGSEIAAVSNAANLAARLQSEAEPNQIIVSEDVHKQIDGLFDFLPAKSVLLKGYDSKQQAFPVAGLGSYASHSEKHSEQAAGDVIRRGAILNTLWGTWQETVQEKKGQSVLLKGPGGIGKTTMLRECRKRIDEDAQSITLYASRFAQHSAFDPVKRFLKRAIAEQADGSLERWVAEIVSDAESGDYAEMLEILLGRKENTKWPPNVLRERLFEYLVGLLAAMSNIKPVLLLAEDLHWLDASSAELLSRLRRAFSERALLVMASSRPSNLATALREWDVTIELEPMGAEQVQALIDSLDPDRRLNKEIRQRIAEKAGGVPLLVREFTRAMLSTSSTNRPSSQIIVPDSLLESFAAQLDQWAAAKDILDAAAAIGEEFETALLARILKRPEDEIVGTLNAMVAGGLMQSYSMVDRVMFDFSHALLRDAAYNTLLTKQKHALHQRVLEACKQHDPNFITNYPSQAAHHLAATGAYADAVGILLGAAQACFAASQFNEALGLIEHGIELLSKIDDKEMRARLELHLQTLMGLTLTQLRGFADEGVNQAYTRAWALCADIEGESEAEFMTIWGIWAHRFVMSDTQTAFELLEKLESIAATLGHDQLKVLVNADATAMHFSVGNFSKALDHAAEVVKLYKTEQHGQLALQYSMDPKAQALSFASHCHAILGNPEEAERARQDAFAHAETLNLKFILPYTRIWGLSSTLYLDKPDAELVPALVNYTALAGELGNLFWVCAGMLWQGVALSRLGEHANALQNFHAGIDLADKIGLRFTMPLIKSAYAFSLARNGDMAKGSIAFKACIEQAKTTGELAHLPEIHRLYAEALILDDPASKDEAETQLRLAHDVARQLAANGWVQRIQHTAEAHQLGKALTN